MGKVSKATKKFQKKHLGAAIRQRHAHKRKKQQDAARGGPCTRAPSCRWATCAGLMLLQIPACMLKESRMSFRRLLADCRCLLPPPPPAATLLVHNTRVAASKRPAGEEHHSEDEEQGGKPRKALEDMSIDEFLDGGFLDVAAQASAAGPPFDDGDEDEGGRRGSFQLFQQGTIHTGTPS